MTRLWLPVGGDGVVVLNRVVAVMPWGAAPIQRLVHEEQVRGKVLDLTGGQARQAVIVLDSGHLVLSGVAATALAIEAEK